MQGRKFYLLKRGILTIVAIYVVTTLVFIMFRLSPGQPVALFVDPTLPAESRERLIAQFGLDQPAHVQYWNFITNIFSGSLGMSFTYTAPVEDLILSRLPNTVVLTVAGVLLAFLIGPFIGAYLSWNRATKKDTAGIGVVLLLRAAPAFWVGMIGLMIFSFWLGWFPSGGIRSAGSSPDGLIETYVSLDFLWHLTIPLITVTMFYLSIPALVMRNNMVDVLDEDFIEMNRAQGLPEWRIMYKHAARNAMLPVVHYGAIAIGFAFAGSVVIERVFSWPGIGLLMWEAVEAQDYPLAQGTFLVFTVIILTMNFIADVVSVYVDPRASELEEL